MLRTLGKLAFLAFLVAVGAAGLVLHGRNSTAARLTEAQRRNEQLKQVVQRLSSERRVADVIVTGQSRSDGGALKTTLLFVEYARDGSALPGKRFVIDGDVAHVDAMVIKFEHDLVQNNDPLRGHSIALFRRIYGENQPPEKGFPVDPPGQVPDVYRGSAPYVSDFERELWSNFWRLAEDETYRKEKGVRVAQGEAVWAPFKPDLIYTITLESDGGLNITSAPLKGIYREALRRNDPPGA